MHFSFAAPAGTVRPLLALTLSVSALLLSACGGGGGGGDAPQNPSAAGAVAITASNQQAVAAHALDSATNIDAARSSSSIVTGVQVEAGAAGAGPVRLASVVRLLAARAGTTPALATGVAINETMSCSQGGSIVVSGEVAGGDAIVAGDNVTVAMNACREFIDGTLVTLGGNIAIRITAGRFNPNVQSFPSHIVMAVNATSLSVGTAAETLGSSGDLLIDITETSPTAGTVVLSGAALSNTVTSAGGSRNFTLRNYTQQLSLSNGATSFTVTAGIETSNSRLGTGTLSYNVSTPSAILMTAAGDFSGGSLRVVGAANSAVLVTVTGTNVFQLQLDANGDGSFEPPATTLSLTQLRAQL